MRRPTTSRVRAMGILLALWGAVAGCGKQEDYAAHQRAQFEENKAKAEKGDATAMYFVAEAYRSGSGAPADPSLAAEWYRKSADAGNSSAAQTLSWAIVESRRDELAAACTSAFRGTSVGLPGKGKPPSLLLWSRDERAVQAGSRSSTPGAERWKADNNHSLPPKMLARSVEEVRSVVCLLEQYVQVGTYETTNSAAVRLDYEVRVIGWPGGDLVAVRTFPGGDPPKERTHSTGAMSWERGAPPDEAAVTAWLEQVFSP